MIAACTARFGLFVHITSSTQLIFRLMLRALCRWSRLNVSPYYLPAYFFTARRYATTVHVRLSVHHMPLFYQKVYTSAVENDDAAQIKFHSSRPVFRCISETLQERGSKADRKLYALCRMVLLSLIWSEL